MEGAKPLAFAMHSFPAPALRLVEEMRDAAARDPARAMAFQGAPGANSHKAALELSPDCLPLPCFGFEDALEAVADGRAGSAIIPIENSRAGRVADIHFLLPESGLAIIAEHFMPIRHALMGLPREGGPRKGGPREGGAAAGPFEAAYSHPQALAQSREYLRARGIVPLSHADTAGAAAFVAERGDYALAAIAPALAAELYCLAIVEDGVEDAPDNTTRFVALARKPLDPASLAGEEALTTFVFEVKNIPAALYKVLGCFATNGVNMTKLESYQKGASFAATMFYADIIGAPGTQSVDNAFTELAYYSEELRMFGSYRMARVRG